MNLLDRFLEQVEFSSYEEFCRGLKFKVPENFNFAYDVVDVYAEQDPEKLAIVWCNDNGGEKFITFGELKRQVDKTANFLKGQGIKKGDKVMLILRRRYEFYYFVLALSKIGAIYIPSTDQLTEKDIIYRNNAASVKMIVAFSREGILKNVEGAVKASPTVERLVLVGGGRDGWVDFDAEVEKMPDTFARPQGDEATNNDDIMVIFFTSGTTSMPKMTAHNFIYPIAHIVTSKYWHKSADGGLHLTVADSGWAKFAWGKLYGQWICGSVIFVYDMDKFDPEKLLRKIEKYRLTTFCAPPTIYRFFMQQDLSKFDLSSVQHWTTAGELLNPEILQRFKKVTGKSIANGFGQTETIVMIADFEWIEPKPGAMGRETPLFEMDIIDEDGNSCPAGVEGELVIRNVDTAKPIGLFCGYWMDEEVTKKVWHDNTYHTGDVVYKDEHGYYWFVGRNDDVIKASGYRISPFEVESALIEHPAVVECAVTGAPDKVRGTVVKATVVLAKGYEAGEELKKELQEHVKTVTAPYKYPRIIDFVDELPKTISGKIKRAQIRSQDREKAL